jgi:hypothetical protein
MSNLTQEKSMTIGDDSKNQILSNTLKNVDHNTRSKINNRRPNTISLTSAEAEQKIGTPTLKPRLMNRLFALKTSSKYDQELLNQNHMQTLTINSNTKLAVVPGADSEIQKNQQVEYKDSIANGLHWCLADAGFFNSRRFRVTFSIYPTSCTYTQLMSQPRTTYFRNSVQLVTPILVNIGNLNTTPEIINSKLETIRQNSERYLQIQLELTNFLNEQQQQQNGISRQSKLPFLRPEFSNKLIKQFAKCTQELRNSIGRVDLKSFFSKKNINKNGP